MAFDTMESQPKESVTSLTSWEGRSVRRCPQDLRMHPAVEHIGANQIHELSEAAESRSATDSGPVHVTADGTILAGFGAWRLAKFGQLPEIECVEHSFDEEQSVQFILIHHQPRSGWNAFNRIRVALSLERLLQDRALENQRLGGKYKGSANLPKAQHLDIREQIARRAGVGTRNVTVVKTILRSAHPKLIEALACGLLTIHRAARLCSLSKSEQLKEFTAQTTNRVTDNVIRHSITELLKADSKGETAALLGKLAQIEKQHRGSVLVRLTARRRTTVLLGQDIMNLESVASEKPQFS